jgi:hypothetical protein
MVDTPVGDRVKTTYRGHIKLNAVPSEGNAKTCSRSRADGSPQPPDDASSRTVAGSTRGRV